MAGLPGSNAMVSVGPPLSASGPSLGSVKVSPPAGVFETISVFTNRPHVVPPHPDPLVPDVPLGLPAPAVPAAPALPWFHATVQLMRLHVPSPPPNPAPPSPPSPPGPAKPTRGQGRRLIWPHPPGPPLPA